MNNCPSCKQTPEHNDMVICKTKGCTEYDLKYNIWEWNELPSLLELGVVIEESILNG